MIQRKLERDLRKRTKELEEAKKQIVYLSVENVSQRKKIRDMELELAQELDHPHIDIEKGRQGESDDPPTPSNKSPTHSMERGNEILCDRKTKLLLLRATETIRRDKKKYVLDKKQVQALDVEAIRLLVENDFKEYKEAQDKLMDLIFELRALDCDPDVKSKVTVKLHVLRCQIEDCMESIKERAKEGNISAIRNTNPKYNKKDIPVFTGNNYLIHKNFYEWKQAMYSFMKTYNIMYCSLPIWMSGLRGEARKKITSLYGKSGPGTVQVLLSELRYQYGDAPLLVWDIFQRIRQARTPPPLSEGKFGVTIKCCEVLRKLTAKLRILEMEMGGFKDTWLMKPILRHAMSTYECRAWSQHIENGLTPQQAFEKTLLDLQNIATEKLSYIKEEEKAEQEKRKQKPSRKGPY